MDTKQLAIHVEGLNKVYRLYDHNRDRLIDSLGLARKKRYREHFALNNVDLDVYQGECVGIIGTNGSGKSTILKIITGVLNPTSGTVQVNGRISALLELGAGFNYEYNGIENVYLNGTMIGFSEKEIDEKLQDILDFADIGDYVYQPVKTYSSGMFVRLAFAVAINIDPEILIVDEALSVGDVFFQAKCYHKFEEFKKQGKTILFVSHDLSAISKYCDRAVLLNQGVKLGEGSPRDMIDIYKQVLVGQYELPSGDKKANLAADEDIRKLAAKKADGGASRTSSPAGETAQEQTAQTGQAEEENAGQPAAEGEGRPVPGLNIQALEYGTKEAEIVEYYMTDGAGLRTSAILKGESFTLHMKVKIHKDIAAPIFALSIKNIKGVEITGTNTMVERSFLESVKAGEVLAITFTQKVRLQGGEYLLSLGVTGYEKDAFTVYHRLYDILNLTVISDHDTVGYFDMESDVKVEYEKKF
ncbi:MAG TPA: ABC transporter ATP-binding protein [Candidatus Eisenbergiella pullistercoris]|uniref:ABC transporter ATP-binding protein n=1 Tax=Candidatus Eisenbergiella pullistercoris TaxID=2838555 RepID=A0A9D1YPC9_9FIRM|nr:ABC transporter ATP-binding protein [Candidatus Eisenbergiella pullistercoris]